MQSKNKNNTKEETPEEENSKIPIGFYLCIANIISLIICNFLK